MVLHRAGAVELTPNLSCNVPLPMVGPRALHPLGLAMVGPCWRVIPLLALLSDWLLLGSDIEGLALSCKM